MDTFRLDMRRYPKELDELVKKPSDDKNWDGPYLKKDLPTDPGSARMSTSARVMKAGIMTSFPMALMVSLEATEKMPISTIGKAVKKDKE